MPPTAAPTAAPTVAADCDYAWPTCRPLLTAEWRNLAMLNYEIDPQILKPLVPAGTELDYWNDITYVSIVGFEFVRTRFFGFAVPFHANFVEVNLRFYVRRRAAEGWRRGVAFIRELAPRRAVALVANVLYGERYLALPMSHRIEPSSGDVPRRVEYRWNRRGQAGVVSIEPEGPAQSLFECSHEQYIAEHYWGYSNFRGSGKEYQVAHPSWQISPARTASFECDDVATLYGKAFINVLSGEPTSAFWANGSAVRVYPGRRVEDLNVVS